MEKKLTQRKSDAAYYEHVGDGLALRRDYEAARRAYLKSCGLYGSSLDVESFKRVHGKILALEGVR